MRASTAISLAGCALVATLACNRESRGDKVNEASVASSGEPPSVTGEPAPTGEVPVSEPMRAQAELIAAEGAAIDGYAKFTQETDGVLVVLDVEGAAPGEKGVVIHTHGDCSDMAGQSMGPHFAPKLEQHALPSEATSRHLGDLGNILVGEDGKGHLEVKVPSATLGADESTTFLGRALIVHSGADTGSGSQPAGNSGAPVACGIIHERSS